MAIICVVILLLLFILTSFRKGKFPPGPMGLPLIGHLGRFGRNTYDVLHQYHKKYGKNIYLRMGLQDIIM